MRNKNIVYINKIEYKHTCHIRLSERYKEHISIRIDELIEGAFAKGYNACLDDVRPFLPSDINVGKRPKD